MKDFRDGYGKTTPDKRARQSGFISLEEVQKEYDESYADSHWYTKVELKAWLHYGKSRTRNGNLPITFDSYCHTMTAQVLHDMVKYNTINVDDIGGKEEVMKQLQNWF